MSKIKSGLVLNGFTLIQKVGKGATAEVWSANDQDNTVYALKIFAPEFNLDDQVKAIIFKEFSITKNLRHPNIITPIDLFEFEDIPILVFELADSSLWDEYELRSINQSKDVFTEREYAKIINDVCKAILYLSDNGIVHDDIKPANILLKKHANRDSDYCLTDFGISRNLRDTILRQTVGNSSAFSFAYASPEKHSKHYFSVEGDVFSLGASIFDMTNRIKRAPGIQLNIGKNIEDIEGNYTNLFKQLVSSMLIYEPNDRISIEELIYCSNQYLKEGFWEIKSIITNDDSNKILDVDQTNTSELVAENQSLTQPLSQNSISAYNTIESKSITTKKSIFSSSIFIALIIAAGSFVGYKYFKDRPVTDLIYTFDCACEHVENKGTGVVDRLGTILIEHNYKNCRILNDGNIELTKRDRTKYIFNTKTRRISE